jgi:hypothetical protein
VVLFTLFPLGVLAGLLSPGVIGLQTTQTAAEIAAGAQPPLDFDNSSLSRSPLLVPRDFSAGFIPELLDLDQLFRDTEFRVDPSGDRLARLLAFPRSHGDAIVLDDVDGYPLDLLFDDALVGDTIASIPDGLSDASGLWPICLPRWAIMRYTSSARRHEPTSGGGPELATGFRSRWSALARHRRLKKPRWLTRCAPPRAACSRRGPLPADRLQPFRADTYRRRP